MRLDRLGYEMTAAEEGEILYPYDDGTPRGLDRRMRYDASLKVYVRVDGKRTFGHATIGVGHLIRPGEIFGDITTEQSQAIFVNDSKKVEEALADLVPDSTPGWNQHRYNAAFDFGFNCGPYALVKYHIINPLLTGDLTLCESQWKAVNKSVINGVLQVDPRLVRRRAREWTLFMTPMPVEEKIDAAEILARVHKWAEQETEDFRRGSSLPDEPQTPAPDTAKEEEA